MSSPPPKHSLSSPTSGNTPHPVLPTPSSSTSVSLRQNNKAIQLRQELEQQLAEKQKQLQESSSGIGKNVLARQVSQLQDRIKEIDSSSNDEIHPVSVDRLRSLERDLSSYRTHPLSPGISSIRNKEKLLNQRSAAGLDPLPSPSTSTLLPPTHGHDSTSLLPLPPPPTGSTPTKRRSKIPNTDRRNTDIEFATEIGQGLLLEVRKMQALLQEKEEKLRTLENQKADLERAAEAMAKQMRQREENEEKLKEETWNLELAKQELTISVTELQQNLSKANVEQNKLGKQVNTLRTEIEQLRDREEKLTHTIDTMKQRHEQDMSAIRRHAAAMQREKTDQTKQIETLTSELAIAKAQSRINNKHVATESEPITRSGETTDDQQQPNLLTVKPDTSPNSSAPSSPKQLPTRNQAMEVETLKTSLAHAHRMVSNLRSNLHKEKTEKFEFKKLLADSQETIEQLQNDPRMWVDAGPTRNNSTMISRGGDDSITRRPHKASTSTTTRRRVKKNSTAGRSKLKPPHLVTVGDDSVYSYSSMSEDSEDMDSFEESDAGSENTRVNNKKKNIAAAGFTPLSSELSQVHKPIMVDAQVNTDPLDDFMLPASILDKSEQVVESPITGSLGDELGRAMLQKEDDDDQHRVGGLVSGGGGLLAGIGAALGLSKETSTQTDDDDESGVESNTQTEESEMKETSIQTDLLSLEKQDTSAVSIAPKLIELETVSQEAMQVEPEDPSIALSATAATIAAAIASARSESLEAAVSCSTEIDPEIALANKQAIIAEYRAKSLENAVEHATQFDADIANQEKEAWIAESRVKSFEAAVNGSTQFDPEMALVDTQAIISEYRTKSLEAAVEHGTQFDDAISQLEIESIIANARTKSIEAGINSSTEMDPSMLESEREAIIADARAKSIKAAVNGFTQIDQDILEQERESIIADARAKSVEAGINNFTQIDQGILEAEREAIIAASRAKSIEAGISCSTQSDEIEQDPSIAIAAAAATAAAVAAGIAEYRAKALETSKESAVQSEPEDPSIALQAIADARLKSIEAGIHCSTQSDEEDPSIALEAAELNAAAVAAAVAKGIADARSKALENAVDTSTQADQVEEDPSVVEARAIATAAAIEDGIKQARSKALEHAVHISTQSEEEDPSIAAAIATAAAAATAAAIASGIADSRSKALGEAVDCSTQFEEDPSVAVLAKEATEAAIAAGIEAYRTKAQQDAVHVSTQSEEIEEDSSVALAAAEATAAAVAAGIIASRSKSIESAVSSSTQSEEEDPSVAEAKVLKAAAKLRAESLEKAVDISTQCESEDPAIAVAATEAAIAASRAAAIEAGVDSSVQSDPAIEAAIMESAIADARKKAIKAAVDTSVQSDEIVEDPSVAIAAAAAAAAATEAAIAASRATALEAAVDQETETEYVEGIDSSVQSGPVEIVDAFVQHEDIISVDHETQYDVVLPVTDSSTQSELREMVESGVQSDERSTTDAYAQYQIESDDKGVQCDETNQHSSAAVVVAPLPPISSRTFSESEDEFFDANSKPSSRRTIDSAIFNNAKPASSSRSKENKIMSSHAGQDGSSKDRAMMAAAAAARNFADNESSKDTVLSSEEYNNAAPKEKMFSKSETDALIATAVALALANAVKDKKENVNQELLEDSKRHTCDMSVNTVDDDDDNHNEEDYGNVLVHCPREEDTITSLPYDENMQRRRDRTLLPIIDTSPLDTGSFESSSFDKPPKEEIVLSKEALSPQQQEQERPELTMGPTLVFSQEPEETEERELTLADIPQRPANPPPKELLNKASLSSTFTEARSLSPTSVRSKGKAPMEYSDMESLSPRSHEDLQRSSIIQQHQQQQMLGAKRGSISASSVSTSNTNEQLRSINSSQYDAVTRSTGTTDPTVINLITQTMIGDWLYKYTRRAVGGGLSERRHQRYFWIHPYTRTLYWSTSAPGVNGNETKAKSALIENITAVPDYTNAADGTPNQSLLIQTSHRQIKLTAPTAEKHELWLEAITHLLARDGSGKGLLNDTTTKKATENRSVSSGSNSLLNRPSFRRLHDIFQQPSSAQSMNTTDDHTDYDDDDEALEDVRMCCNGKHHVSKLEKDHQHRHQYRKRKSRATITTT